MTIFNPVCVPNFLAPKAQSPIARMSGNSPGAGGGGSSSSFNASSLQLFENFEATVTSGDNDGTANQDAMKNSAQGIHAPWSGAKANNFIQYPSANGRIYTVTSSAFTTATGESYIPGVDGASRVGVFKGPIDDTTQGDTFLGLGTETDTDRTIVPADSWFQFPIFIDTSTVFNLGQWLRPCKWFYPSNDGWPSGTKKWRLDMYMISTSPEQVGFMLREPDTGYGVFDWVNDPNRGTLGAGKLYFNLTPTVGITKGVWTLVKIRIKCGHVSDDNRYEAWTKTYSGGNWGSWTKRAEYVSSDTAGNRSPDSSFTWGIPSAQANGHTGLRWITSIPAANDPPTGIDMTIYTKDWSLAGSENLLPEY